MVRNDNITRLHRLMKIRCISLSLIVHPRPKSASDFMKVIQSVFKLRMVLIITVREPKRGSHKPLTGNFYARPPKYVQIGNSLS